jgi:hypothetical protein
MFTSLVTLRLHDPGTSHKAAEKNARVGWYVFGYFFAVHLAAAISPEFANGLHDRNYNETWAWFFTIVLSITALVCGIFLMMTEEHAQPGSVYLIYMQ